MFAIQYTETFLKIYKKYIRKVEKLEKAFTKTIELIKENPHHPSLNSHKVDTRKNTDIWSSRMTGDWRIAWIYDEKNQIATIILLEVGTHSGSNQIYKKKS
jgi:mRNA-degrading endonuclease YafQ of YafQ-DinJ toxin-antitoxin module